MLPKIIAQSGLSADSFVIEDEAWSLIVRPLGFDAGMRTLERTIQTMARKAAKLMVEGKSEKFQITTENVREFLPR